MAAGLGFIEFTTGDVLTAADANGYLASQVVMVFNDAAARTAAITSPQEGMITYLKDTNAVETYDGAAYVAVGGSSPLTTKGDLYTFSTVDARLAVGANGTVLTADSAEATGIKWATPTASSGPIFRASRTSNQTPTNNAFTKVQFDVENFDTASCYDPTTNFRFTPNVAGYYEVASRVSYTSETANGYTVIYFNGAAKSFGGRGVGSTETQDYIAFNGTTDNVEIFIYTESSAVILGSATSSYFAASFIRGL